MQDESKIPLKGSFMSKLTLMYEKQKEEPQIQTQSVQQPKIARDQYLQTEIYLQENRSMYEESNTNHHQQETQQYLQAAHSREQRESHVISNYQDYVLAKAQFMSSPKLQQQLVRLILKNQQLAQELNNQNSKRMIERLKIEDVIITTYLTDFKLRLERKIINICDHHKVVFEYQMSTHYTNIKHMVRQITMDKINSLCAGSLKGQEVLQEIMKNQIIKFLEEKLYQYSQAISQILNSQVQALVEGSLNSIEEYYLKDRESVGNEIGSTLGRLQVEMKKIEGRLTESIQNIQNNLQHDQLRLIPIIQQKQIYAMEMLKQQP